MVKEKTTLILGAGASEPFGYPLGGQLVLLILDERNNQESQSVYQSCGLKAEELKKFYDQLYRSQTPSIDLFLQNNPNLTKIGKLHIAKVLISFEKEDELFGNPNGPGINTYGITYFSVAVKAWTISL